MRIVNICLAGCYTDGLGFQDNMLSKYEVLAGNDVWVISKKYVQDTDGSFIKTGEKYSIGCNGEKIIRLEQIGVRKLHKVGQIVYFKGLYKNLLAIKPDIIYIHNPQIMNVKSITKYIKENKEVRLLVDSHCDYSNSATNIISKYIVHGILWRNRIKTLLPYVEVFYGVLPARVSFLHERYKIPSQKTELMLMGSDNSFSDKEKLKKEMLNRLQIKENDFIIVTGGKINSSKQQTLLLVDAIKEINEKYHEIINNRRIRLIIFGDIDNKLKNEFEELINCNDFAMFIGWLNVEEIFGLFSVVNLAVFPGRHSVLWEQAVGQGLPIIVKYWSGTTHVDLGGNCKFLYHDKKDEIIKAITDALNPDAYIKMKKVSEEKGPLTFSYSEIVNKIIYRT